MTICLNMIVKDESRVILRCLESVKELIDYWVIVDTGSTDKTKEIIREFLKDIPGELHERPWVHFGHNRNEALALARGKADYFLFIDADDRLVRADSFEWPLLEKDAYIIMQHVKHRDRSVSEGDVRPVYLLIKDLPDYRWSGALHESIAYEKPKTSEVLSGLTCEYLHDGHRAKDPQRFLKDAQMLENAILDDPENTKNVFYLATTYACADDYHSAIRCYEKRAAMGGSELEVFHSLYTIGLMQRMLGYQPEIYIKSLSRAFLYRPSRAEPLFDIAAYYLLQIENSWLAYLITKLALSVKPSDPIPQGWAYIYDWGLLWYYFHACKNIEKYAEVHSTACELLAKPNFPQNLREDTENLKKFVCKKLRRI